jgi:N-carbamoyl-L-amino-acid hydrolase
LGNDDESLTSAKQELHHAPSDHRAGFIRMPSRTRDFNAEARRLCIGWCEAAGCTVRVDRIGNIFARRRGRDPSLPPVMRGSHLDTQPTGGKFDGAYGVMAALEVVRTLNDFGGETAAPIKIVAWTNEEGSRFSPVMAGSGSSSGSLISPRVWPSPIT